MPEETWLSENILKLLLDTLRQVPHVQDVLTPLPIEYYISKLRDETTALAEAYFTGFVEAVAYHACRIIAIAAQILDRVLNVKEIIDKLNKIKKLRQVGILT